MVRRLQDLTGKDTSRYMGLTDYNKAYDSVDRTLLRTVLARVGMPPRMIAAIR